MAHEHHHHHHSSRNDDTSKFRDYMRGRSRRKQYLKIVAFWALVAVAIIVMFYAAYIYMA